MAKTDFLNITNVTKMPDNNKIVVFEYKKSSLVNFIFIFLEVKVFIRIMLLWYFVPAVKAKISRGFYESDNGSTCKKS